MHEAGFRLTMGLEMEHVLARHQAALVSVEYGVVGRFLKRPKSFTVFDTNFPTTMFKYKACDLDRMLLRPLKPGQTRRLRPSGPNVYRDVGGLREVVTNEVSGRSQNTFDIFSFD